MTIIQFLRALDEEDQSGKEPTLIKDCLSRCSIEAQENAAELSPGMVRASILMTIKSCSGYVNKENYEEFSTLVNRLLFRSAKNGVVNTIRERLGF